MAPYSDNGRPVGRHAAGAEGPRPLYAGERRVDQEGRSAGATGSTGAVSPHPVQLGGSRSPYAEGRAISTHHPARVIALVAVSLVVLGGLGYGALRLFAPGLFGSANVQEVTAGKTVSLVIPDGAGGQDIATLLYNEGVIASTSAFTKELQAQGADASLKSGAYTFITGSDVSAIVEQLVAGPNDTSGKVTVPEGLTVTQTARAFEPLGITADEFSAQAKASAYANDFPFVSAASDDSLEGFLAPKTYDFSGKDATADDVIRAMLAQWQTDYASLDFEAARSELSARYGVEMSDYELVKLASIIEREAVTADDRPLVSSVFYNRMSQGMALQSDATMMYVTGGEVTAEDLKVESPYNTYLNQGFPPTPICTPSIESVQAALGPADTDYYFFYIVEDGTRSIHDFSKTYDEHLEAIDRATQG